ncbi:MULTISPECIES: hypothetical protein [unclassified Streptomyces]|uniref:Uncharacterized protein n=1 Tax=Streptomyces sp. NBC_00119 TaxID=2975659 RepID=A0AAU1U339_9ACTN|nr:MULTISPECIES: hypothetical protein [unclassified Streptomyces]MCX4641408.1 hypothetical protein [Streptomyces sp. NBC_01446]MCX5322171.1 hypothetical protein [Streptomyces sp. NBC_00120]
MRLARTIAMIGAAATAAISLGASAAHAQDDGSLVSLAGAPSLTLACFPAGQVGQGNTFTGTQNVSCSQSATQSNPTPPAVGGGNGGATSSRIVRSSAVPVPANGTAFIAAYCDTGEVATGGGYNVMPVDANVSVTFSTPGDVNGDGRADAWGVNVHNNTAEQVSVSASVICSADSATP